MKQTGQDDIRAVLEEERAEVEHQLLAYGATTDKDGAVDVPLAEAFADSAQATAERAERLSLIDQLRSNYEEIVAALRRLDDGTYGRCDRCGEEIPVERLEALPTATLCVTCKERA